MRRLLPSLAAAAVLLPGPVWAALRVPAPPGWDRGSMVPSESFADAEALAAQADCSLIEVFAGPEEDDYIESVVVLEQASPLEPAALEDDEQARAVVEQWAGRWVDSPTELEVVLVDRGETMAIEASFEADGVIWMLLIAPTGASTGVVVVRGQADELPLYRRTFQEVIDSAAGAEPPVEPIKRNRSRLFAGIGWLLGTAAAGGIGMATAPVAGDIRHASKRAAIVLAAAAVVVAGVLLAVFLSKSAAVEAGGASPVGFALELTAYGVVLAGLAYALSVFGPEPKRIQSAPTNLPRLPTAKPGELRPSTVPSRLEPADTRSTIPPNSTIEVPTADEVVKATSEDTQPRARATPRSLTGKHQPIE